MLKSHYFFLSPYRGSSPQNVYIIPHSSSAVYLSIYKTQQSCLFPEIMTLLLKMIHRPCCEQFHVGTTFLLTTTTYTSRYLQIAAVGKKPCISKIDTFQKMKKGKFENILLSHSVAL